MSHPTKFGNDAVLPPDLDVVVGLQHFTWGFHQLVGEGGCEICGGPAKRRGEFHIVVPPESHLPNDFDGRLYVCLYGPCLTAMFGEKIAKEVMTLAVSDATSTSSMSAEEWQQKVKGVIEQIESCFGSNPVWASMSFSDRNFLTGILNWWKTRHYLTKKQVAAAKRCCVRLLRKKG